MFSVFKYATLLVVIALFSFAQPALAAKYATLQTSCMEVYQPASNAPSAVTIEGRETWQMPEPGAIGDFAEARYTPTGRTFELKHTEVSNQCRTSECYLFAVINYIHVNNMHNNASRVGPMRVSEPFLVAHKFLQHIIEGVWYGVDNIKVVHDLKGGFGYEAVQLTRKVGIVPKESWTPNVPFESWDMNQVYSTLQTKVPEWNRYLQSLANKYGTWEHPEVRKAQQLAYDTLKKTVLDLTGPLPESFTFNGTVYTPKEFEGLAGLPRERKLAIDNKEGFALPSNAKEVLNEAMVNTGGSWKFQEGDYNTIINETVRFLEAGHPVIIDLRWKADGHSMLITGYEYNAQNKITRLKVMNSWGPSYANDGYVWYTLDDVWNNVSRVYKFGAL